MKNNFTPTLISISLIMLLSSACGGGSTGSASLSSGSDSSSSSQESGGSVTGTTLNSSSVTSVEFDDNNLALVDFSAVEDDSQYILELYAYNSSKKSGTYQVDRSDAASSINSYGLVKGDYNEEENFFDDTEDFHHTLRGWEEELDDDALLDPDGPAYSKAVVKAAAIGSTRTFKVINSLTNTRNYDTVTAELIKETSNFVAYVDVRNVNNINKSRLIEKLEAFDDIVDDEEALFGTTSDVDGDGKSTILFTQTVNDLGSSSGGIVTGFFYAVDLFSASTYSQSNEMEIIYAYVPDPTISNISEDFLYENIISSVLPHEYQHMINFNMHYFVNQGLTETSSVNEGCSHLAEDLYSINSSQYMTTSGIENASRIRGYLESPEDLCITCGSSLYQRGGIYLLLRYLYEQAEKGNLDGASSGREFISNLLDTRLTGVSNIVNAALGSVSDVETSFRNLLGQYGLAVYLDNTGLSNDNRFSIDGINLRTTQNDNRYTLLEGPKVNTLSSYSLTKTVTNSSLSYIKLTGSEIKAMGSSLKIQLSSDAKIGAYLIKLQ